MQTRGMRILALAAAGFAGTFPLAAEKAQERLQESTAVFQEIMATPDKGIPEDLLAKAHCVVIIPGAKKGAFIVGAQYGRGFVTCRRQGHTGWGAPAAVRMEGGSVGFQIGGAETDIVMLVMNDEGVKQLLESKFTLGGSATVAAGPVGRSATAQTDAQMTAGILGYSRSRGAFAGISLNGATLRNDLDENQELYGKRVTNREVIMEGAVQPTAAAQPLLTALNRYSRVEEGHRTRTPEKKTQPERK